MPDDASRKCLGCADLVRHERELRETAALIIDERFKAQAQALALQTEALEKRLHAMNEFRDENRRNMAATISRAEFDGFKTAAGIQHDAVVKAAADANAGLKEIRTVVATLRWLVAVVGTPGILALIWSMVAAAAGRTVTGPGGLFP